MTQQKSMKIYEHSSYLYTSITFMHALLFQI
jgi:hypothetical protein